jgi:hypothetical protein
MTRDRAVMWRAFGIAAIIGGALALALALVALGGLASDVADFRTDCGGNCERRIAENEQRRHQLELGAGVVIAVGVLLRLSIAKPTRTS